MDEECMNPINMHRSKNKVAQCKGVNTEGWDQTEKPESEFSFGIC